MRFLTSYARVLLALAHTPALSVTGLAAVCGTSERTVQRIIAELVRAGFLTREADGRRVRLGVRHEAAACHPCEGRLSVRSLLRLVRAGTGEET
ncbi:helix-turn-helix domain-containing protein [Streptomyces sp. NPDC052109]|uniref:MarR family transcriptional regulator n=1 Tax=Streptomyces sp. NPDC052109 TaxID=3155527 RepID=UPI00343494BD